MQKFINVLLFCSGRLYRFCTGLQGEDSPGASVFFAKPATIVLASRNTGFDACHAACNLI